MQQHHTTYFFVHTHLPYSRSGSPTRPMLLVTRAYAVRPDHYHVQPSSHHNHYVALFVYCLLLLLLLLLRLLLLLLLLPPLLFRPTLLWSSLAFPSCFHQLSYRRVMDYSQNAVDEDTSELTKNLDGLERKLYVGLCGGEGGVRGHYCGVALSFPMIPWRGMELCTLKCPLETALCRPM